MVMQIEMRMSMAMEIAYLGEKIRQWQKAIKKNINFALLEPKIKVPFGHSLTRSFEYFHTTNKFEKISLYIELDPTSQGSLCSQVEM